MPNYPDLTSTPLRSGLGTHSSETITAMRHVGTPKAG